MKKLIAFAAAVEQALNRIGLSYLPIAQENYLCLPDRNLWCCKVILNQFAGFLEFGGFVAGLIEQADRLDRQFYIFNVNTLEKVACPHITICKNGIFSFRRERGIAVSRR